MSKNYIKATPERIAEIFKEELDNYLDPSVLHAPLEEDLKEEAVIDESINEDFKKAFNDFKQQEQSIEGDSNDVVLSVRHLKQYFKFGTGIYKYNKAVHDVSFDIHRGEVLGLVGESGCGKTTTGRSIIKLYNITSGDVYFEGVRIGAGTRWNEKEIKFKKKAAAKKIKGLKIEKQEAIKKLDHSSTSFLTDKSEIDKKYDALIQQVRFSIKKLVHVQQKKIILAKHDNNECNKDFAKARVYETKNKYAPIIRASFSKNPSINYECIEQFNKIVKKYIRRKLSFSKDYKKEYSLVIEIEKKYCNLVRGYLSNNAHSNEEKQDFIVQIEMLVFEINKAIDQSKFDEVDAKVFKDFDTTFIGIIKALPVDCDESNFKDKKQNIINYFNDWRLARKSKITSKIQMIFQDPIASLDPRMTVKEIIAEGLRIRGIRNKKYIDEKVNSVLKEVGLLPEHSSRYPHEFSGGQRQRIGIARALIMDPDLIIADEPISALDVSIAAQVINLLNDLRKERNLTILFIAHDLSVVKYFCDRIAVMYFGNLVELASSDRLFMHPLHPYTRSLLSAIPLPDPHYEKNRKRIDYNPLRDHDYSKEKPSLRLVEPGHFVRCNTAEFNKYEEDIKK